MNERKTQKALKKFCENQYWKEYYETAPTGACKRYIELEFYYLDYWGQIPDYDKLKKESDSLEEEFVKADWAHLYKYYANNPKKFIIKIKWKSTKKKNNNIITSVSDLSYRGVRLFLRTKTKIRYCKYTKNIDCSTFFCYNIFCIIVNIFRSKG